MPTHQKEISGAVAWASVETVLRQGLQLGSTIVLARLLTPADFGLVAMLAIFVVFAARIAESGFATALVQQEEESNADSSTAFWFNIGTGTLMALLLCASAPYIARFYGHPELVRVTWAMALNVWLTSWLTVHSALLTRHLEFRTLAIASGVANFTGAALAIVLALRGAGIWALVAQIVVTTLLNVVVIWRLHPWRPVAIFSYRSFRKLFNFGGYMLASTMLDTAATRLYSLLIGRIYSSHDLGLYSHAVSTRDSSQTMLSTIFSRVAFPVLARHGNDPVALQRRLKSANQLTMAINLPAMIGLSVVANLAVPTVFGGQWSEAGPILQVLCIAGALFPMQLANVQVLMAQGHSGKVFRIGAIKNGILITSILIAAQWGILAIAWASVASAVISFLINTHYSHKFVGYGAMKQLRDLAPYLALTAVMAAIVVLIAHTFSWLTPGKRLLVEVTGGAVFYIGIAHVLRLPAVGFAFHVLRSLRSR